MSAEWESSLVRRAAVHAALAEPARLAMVDLLALGDASPSELQATVRLPSNLLAHHLKALERAGLVGRTRSEGDRRRSYLRLVPGVLSDLVPVGTRVATRVVFVCTHNSARSQLAAALWRERSPLPVTSAGTEPAARIHPRALSAAHRRHLSLPARRPRHVHDVLGGGDAGDLVVAVCDAAHEHLDRPAGRLHWSVPDPARTDTDEAFDRVLDELTDRVTRLAERVRPDRATDDRIIDDRSPA